MCGITGVFYYRSPRRVDADVLTGMRDTMIHRGPDGAGNWISSDGRVGLAHRRLSIIDLSKAASQPMPNEDESVWTTFNGEIYNHMRLRAELQEQDHTFRTDHSDTEVIVHGFEQWGIDGLLSRMEGDYGFAIWDDKNSDLYLVRDRIGVKPLYFAIHDGAILFGSEIKAILSHPGVPRDIESIAMYHYLSFLTTPAPFTMFKGIFKLPAGYCLHVNRDGKFRSFRYWDAMPGRSPLSKKGSRESDRRYTEEDYIRGIRDNLEQSVEKRMMSDVPFGVFLSGGIDSSTNVALMSRHMDRPVDTFTVGFKDHKHLNELDEANLVAKKFNTNHHQILIDESDMRGYLDQLIHHQDEPIADWVCIPLYFVSKLAKDSGVTVVQVGEGADEQFCGYASYMGYLELYRKYWRPFQVILPHVIQRMFASSAKAAAGWRPTWEVYADIIDRAARGREHFWSGATVFWDVLKSQLVSNNSIDSGSMPAELIESGMLPESYLETDSFNIVKTFFDTIDGESPGSDVLTRMIYSEFKLRLPELLLMRVDKIGMSVSLEARVPFLDHHLVEYTMDIPMSEKIQDNTAKYLLKKAVEGLIPHEIIYRKKMGFGAPMSQWLSGDFGREAETSMMASRLLDRGYFNRTYLANLFSDHKSGRRDNSLYIWTMFNLTAWYDYWIDGAPT
jgi:asparagine synthase (glutamine-hydrolysing)